MSVWPMPPSPSGSAAQQLTAQYGYLFQLARQLNAVLGALDADSSRKADTAALAQNGRQSQQYDTLRTMIVRTADAAKERMEQLSAYLELPHGDNAPAAAHLETVQNALARLENAVEEERQETRQTWRRGIVRQEGTLPVYGMAAGDGLLLSQQGEDTEIAPRGLRAVLTPEEISLWQDGTRLACTRERGLRTGEMDVDVLTAGAWRIEAEDGLCVQWTGGTDDGSDSQ